MKTKEFFTKNREILQLVYGVVLIIVIPTLIALNTVYIIKKYNKNIDNALLHQSLNIARSMYALMADDLEDNNALQKNITEVIKRNSSFEEMNILKPEGEDFKVVASSNAEEVGEVYTGTFYKRAWISPDNEGIATPSFNLAGVDENDRFWLSAIPMRGENGEKQAILSLKISSKIIDTITHDNRNAAIFYLVLTVLVVIAFLFTTIRLWDYALLYRKIKEVDKMKDEFISIASHELRTPVTSIRGFSSMILDGTFGKVNEKIRNNLKIIKDSSERLAFLVEDILNVSRIEQGRLKITKKPTDVGPILKDTVAELKIQSNEKKLKLEYKPHADKLPQINIDTERFKQVLINLIGNAIKYTEKGGVEILTQVKNNKTLEFRIKDTGIGMSSEARERLFQKFYRVQDEKTKDITGTGLGLWITKKIIELMDGKIMVDSIEGSGTQVTLNFPIIKK